MTAQPTRPPTEALQPEANGRVLVVLGHPRRESLCGALAQSYADAAEAAGATVRRLALGELSFDPVLRHGYQGEQALEHDLALATEHLRWAQHVVWVHPNWWGGPPALLKGFIDRVFLPGVAFRYRRDGSSAWDRLLAGRSSRLIVTMDSPPWYFRWVQRMPGHQQMRRSILGFSGFDPVDITSLGPVRGSSPERRQAWLQQVADLGHRDVHALRSRARR